MVRFRTELPNGARDGNVFLGIVEKPRPLGFSPIFYPAVKVVPDVVNDRQLDLCALQSFREKSQDLIL